MGAEGIGQFIGSLLRARPQSNPDFLNQVNAGLTPSVNPYLAPTSQLKRVFGNNADELNMAFAAGTARSRQETNDAMSKMTKESELGTKRLELTAKLEALRDASLNAYREGNLRLGAQLESQRDQALNALQQGNLVLADQLASGRDMRQAALGMLRDKSQNELEQGNMALADSFATKRDATRNQFEQNNMRLGNRLTQKRDATQQGYSMLNAGIDNYYAKDRMQKGSDLRIAEHDDQIGTTGAERRLLTAPVLQRNVKLANRYNDLLEEYPDLADVLVEEEMMGPGWKKAGDDWYNTMSGRAIQGSRVQETPVFDTTNINGMQSQKFAGMQRRTIPGAVEAPYLPTLRQKKDGSPQGLSPFEGFDPTPYQGGSLEELLRGIPMAPLQPQQPSQQKMFRLINPR